MKIAVGMSGGVDSAAAALILKDAGYDVTGITLRLTGLENENEAIADANYVCSQLGIEHIVADLVSDFSLYVRKYFSDEYMNGRTPNPCIRCNRFIKFGRMYEVAQSNGCDMIATGHYVSKEKIDGTWYIKSADSRKDQSYMLWMLSQDQIEHSCFPIGGRTKEEIRSMLHLRNIELYSKPDSQDICFISDGDYAGYLRKIYNIKDEPGSFVDKSGNTLGTHKGYFNYTVGQRKGLGGGFSQPMFVLAINAEKNEVVLGTAEEKMSDHCICHNINMPKKVKSGESISAYVKIRYSARPSHAKIIILDNDNAEIYFDEPQSAITPGQSAVGYQDGLVVFGGEIV